MSYIELTMLLNVETVAVFVIFLKSLFSSVSFSVLDALCTLIYFTASHFPLTLAVLCSFFLLFFFLQMLNLVISRKNIHWLLSCVALRCVSVLVPPRTFRGFISFYCIFHSFLILFISYNATYLPYIETQRI